MGEHTPDKIAAIYQGFREYWDAAPDSIAKQNALMILRAWADDRTSVAALEQENLGLLDAAVKSAERIEELDQTIAGAKRIIDDQEKIVADKVSLEEHAFALQEHIEALGRKAAAYKEAYLSERAYHANNTGENAARRKKAVATLREADHG